jgi:hypothetical protein
MRKDQQKPAAPPALWADLGREISHFLAGLIILVMINLAPTSAHGKVLRFTDSKGVIHITSASQEQGGKSGKPGAQAPPAGSGHLTRNQGPKPAAAVLPPPIPKPQAEPSPGPQRKGPPPDLGALEQPGAALKISQSPRESGEHPPQASLPESVPYTAAGDPFVNPSLPILPVAAGGPPLVKVARAAAVYEGAIQSFKDRHGVIHITNRADFPEPEGRQWAAVRSRIAHPTAAVSPSAIRPVSWQPDAADGPVGKDISRGNGSISSREAVIHRFREGKGVWHITNVAPAGKALPAASLAARNFETPPAPGVVRAATVQPPLNYPWPKAVEKFGAGPLAGQTTVRSSRDRRGVIHICNAPAQEADRILASLAYMKKSLGPIIAEGTRTYRLPPALVLAVIHTESNFVPQAVSPKGAMGLMQLMPGTANLLGVQDPFNPRENILAGCRYLRDLLDRFKGSLPLAVAAYNAGDSRVVAAGYTIPAIKETRDFVRSVLELYYLIEKGRGGF